MVKITIKKAPQKTDEIKDTPKVVPVVSTAMSKLKVNKRVKKVNENLTVTEVDETVYTMPEIPEDISIYETAMNYIPVGWEKQFEEREKEFKVVSDLLKAREKMETYTPSNSIIFRPFHLLPLKNVRVVIIGQDPYPTPGQADGLAFSSNDGFGIPAPLRNIYKEIGNSIKNYEIPQNANLEHWAKQGVLLINMCLTTPLGKTGVHSKFGIWTPFISSILKAVSKSNKDCYYLLWGKQVAGCSAYIKCRPERLLMTSHPSPLSANRGFFGCNHFKIVNENLSPKIKW